MADEKKSIIHCCIDKDVYDMLIAHCNAKGQTKTTAIKRAIKAYCQPVVEKNQQSQNIQNIQNKE